MIKSMVHCGKRHPNKMRHGSNGTTSRLDNNGTRDGSNGITSRLDNNGTESSSLSSCAKRETTSAEKHTIERKTYMLADMMKINDFAA